MSSGRYQEFIAERARLLERIKELEAGKTGARGQRASVFPTCLTWADMMPSLSKNQGVFKIALFSQNEKSATRISSKLLIFNVDQPGLEPGTSRL